MGMDISAGKLHLHQNWSGWAAMQDILVKHGFTGKLPQSNDGEIVSKTTAKKVGLAMLRFYMERDQADIACKLPQLDRHESACLAYALLLTLTDGKAKHF